LIGVYTRGFHDSIAFKLPEYLANGKAVVAEGIPPSIILPAPLSEGHQYLPFAGIEACLTICDRLLSRPDDVRELGVSARGYYESYCSPTASAQRLLRTIGLPEESGDDAT
jgi:hypothetical protein